MSSKGTLCGSLALIFETIEYFPQERLVKAKMYGQDQKVQELKAEIAKLTEEVNEEDDQEYDERTRKQLEDEKKMVDRLNELSEFTKFRTVHLEFVKMCRQLTLLILLLKVPN